MAILDAFYGDPFSILFTIALLGVVATLSWLGKGRKAILFLTLLLYIRYMVWRAVYTLNTEDWMTTLAGLAVYFAEIYALCQVTLFVYHAWSPLDRRSVPTKRGPTVDVFVTIVNEPLDILRRTLIGCVSQQYPQDKYTVYVLDDGQRDDVKTLAASFGCQYIRRQDRQGAKAGNLNHALQRTTGELIAVFDVDHVPTRVFLKETVGFFDDPRVAFVQTPHHFYNPDIFQRNLRMERVLRNEQALFYRVLQAGRDAHNSAFFAGSCGLFRRQPLLEIGGFKTETVTEDIHTSMLIHARGYKSCYLNKVLAVGLMPESFDAYIKQRTRWAIGHVQMFFKDNPLTLRGLTIPQRLGYLASIHYFLHGLPRVICLTAPLLALLMGIIPVTASVASLVHYFGAYYIATLVMLRTVSHGTRNAFWSEVYETAMCFPLLWANVKTLLNPWKKRPFVVTPKGRQQDKPKWSHLTRLAPHLICLGLLVAGLFNGIRLWMSQEPYPGLEVSLFWGAVNGLFLSVAILAATDRPEWRKTLRVGCRQRCEVLAEGQRSEGVTKELDERGALVRLKNPILATGEDCWFRVRNEHGGHQPRDLRATGKATGIRGARGPRRPWRGSGFVLGPACRSRTQTPFRRCLEA